MRMRNKFYRYLLVILSCCNNQLSAENSVTLNIRTDDGELIEWGEVCVQKSDSVVAFSIIDKSPHVFSLQKADEYELTVTIAGYEPWETRAHIDSDTIFDLQMRKKSVLLNEVVVKGKVSPKTTATGEVYRLTKNAKNCGDPFRALSEIPIIDVDISNQTITMRDGDVPLILIDGKLVNSGIKPIDPKFIDKVEISEVVSAKYLQMGVTKIINIHLKRDTDRYIYIDGRTRNDIPLRYGFGGANFEYGTQKFAVSGYLFGHYSHDDKISYQANETFGNVVKNRNGETIDDMTGWESSLMAKWEPNKSNYFAAVIKAQDFHTTTDDFSNGVYGAENLSNITTSQHCKDLNGGWLAGLFHEHTFNDKSTFTTFLKYNKGRTESDDHYSEEINSSAESYWEYERSLRDQYSVSLDYAGAQKTFGSVALGNNFEYTTDRNEDKTVTPTLSAKVKRMSNYTHASYTGNWKQFYYMASIGFQYLSVDAGGDKNSYWRPRSAISLTLRLPASQSIRGFYYLTNELPGSNQLMRFNNSTNPWLKIEGNPYLMPVKKHSFTLNYDKSIGNFRLQAYGSHNRYSDMIEQYLRNESDVVVQSYRNNGTYKGSTAGTRISFRSKRFIASADASYSWDCFNGQNNKESIALGGSLRWDFGNFFIYSKISWRNRRYTAISTTEYKNPTEAHVQIAWQATRQLYLSVGLPYFWGTRSNLTSIENAEYRSYIRKDYTSGSLRPWLLISWTLRKNANKAIKNKLPNI